jgi:phage pi2 protein 07
LSHINNLKYKKMLELIIGGFIYYMINTIEKERKALKRVKDANKKLFTDDRPKYINI